jgi:hypothetical protein
MFAYFAFTEFAPNAEFVDNLHHKKKLANKPHAYTISANLN